MTVAALMPSCMAADDGRAAVPPGDTRQRPAAIRALRCIAAARTELQVGIRWPCCAENVSSPMRPMYDHVPLMALAEHGEQMHVASKHVALNCSPASR